MKALPAVLLVAMAVTQVVLTRTSDLTPWKGGGFGMFSTLDHGAHRRVVVVVEAPDRSETLEIALLRLDELLREGSSAAATRLVRELPYALESPR